MADIAELGLKADSGEIRGASRDLDRLSREADKAETATQRLARQAEFANKSLGLVSSTVRGFAGQLAAVVSAGAVVRTIKDFDQAMAGVGAVTQATAQDMRTLTAQARELGATTKFSASEAANGMKFLGQAGFTTTQILAAMPAVLKLAAAGELDLAQAADIASNVLTGFGLEASKTADVVDILAVAAAASNTDVAQLGEAMKYAAPVAAALGIEVGETAAIIGALSNAGIQGGQAGTGFRRIMASLVDPTKEAREAIASLGLTVEQLNPQNTKATDIIKLLAEANIDAARASVIFGTEGLSAILALTGQTPAIDELLQKTRNFTGAADQMAGVLSNTLGGDIDELSSSLEELTLQLADGGLRGALRSTFQTLTEGVRLVGMFGTELANLAIVGTIAVMGRLAASVAALVAAKVSAIQVSAAHSAALAENAAREAAVARASAAAAAAKLREVQATQAAIAAARADALAKLAQANASARAAQAAVAAAQANGSGAVAAGFLRNAEAQLTAAMQARAAVTTELAVLGTQQAAVTRQLAVATTAAAAAQTVATGATTRATAAAAAATLGARVMAGAMGLLRGALALLGGPIGAVITGLSLLYFWFTRNKEASKGFADDATRSLKELNDEADKARKGGMIVSPEQQRAVKSAQDEIQALAVTIGQLYKDAEAMRGRGFVANAAALDEKAAAAKVRIKELADELRRFQDLSEAKPTELAGVPTGGNAPLPTPVSDAEKNRIQALREQIALQTRINELMQAGNTPADAEFAARYEAADKLNRQLLVLARTTDVLTDAQEKQAAAEKEAADLYAATRTPLENLNAEIERLNKLRSTKTAAGVELISQDTYIRGVRQAQDEFTAALDFSKQKTDEWSEYTKGAIEQAGRSVQSTLSDFLFDPFSEGLDGLANKFADVVKRMAADLAAAQFAKSLGLGGEEGGIVDKLTKFFGGVGAGGVDSKASDKEAAKLQQAQQGAELISKATGEGAATIAEGITGTLRKEGTAFTTGLSTVFNSAGGSFLGTLSSIFSSLGGGGGGLGGLLTQIGVSAASFFSGGASTGGGSTGSGGSFLSGGTGGSSGIGGEFVNFMPSAAGRAYGGSALAGNMYEVGEGNKPEVLRAAGRQYLIPGNTGEVVPMRELPAGNKTVNNTFNITTPNPDAFRASERQMARRARRSIET